MGVSFVAPEPVLGEDHAGGLALTGAGRRIGILIHPAHPPNLFLSSIDCLNLTSPLAPDTMMDFFDSRPRVIAIVESLREHAPDAFAHHAATRIGTATVKVIGNNVDRIAGG